MANKSKYQKPTNADVEAMKEIYKVAEEKTELKYKEELTDLKSKLSAAPWLHKMAGKIEATSFFKSQAEFFRLVMLKQVKDSKEHREKYGMTWEQFCEYVGVNRRWIDEQLVDLKPFKAEFLEVFLHFLGTEINKIKYLGEVVSGGTAEIKGNVIVYAGEEIPVDAAHKDDIQALLEKLEESYESQIEEQRSVVKTKDRLLKAKDDLIHKQEKELGRLEKEAKTKNLTAEEEAFLKQMENFKTGFLGYMLRVRPPMDILGNGASPLMKNAYVNTLELMRREILASFDTAVGMYGSPVTDPEKAWHPGKTA